MVRPAKGFSRRNRSSMPLRAGMKSRTHWIFWWPEGARDMSFTMLMVILLCYPVGIGIFVVLILAHFWF